MTDKTKSSTTQQYPSEIIDLPTGGKLYGKDHPLASVKIEIKYMTAREEDILTSANLIKQGIVIDKLLDSLILTEGVSCDDLFLGDKNAVMIAARILAYGAEYAVEISDPGTGDTFKHTFDLSDLPYRNMDVLSEIKENAFVIELPVSKNKVTVKILNGKDEKDINQELKALEKVGTSREVTTRLKKCVIAVDGDNDINLISTFVDNMLSRDSFFLRERLVDLVPDIEMIQEVEFPSGDRREMSIPMDVTFFWPSARI